MSKFIGSNVKRTSFYAPREKINKNTVLDVAKIHSDNENGLGVLKEFLPRE